MAPPRRRANTGAVTPCVRSRSRITGALILDPNDDSNDDVAPEIAARIHAAFELGADEGLFHLGAVEVGTALPPSHAYLRDLAHDYVASLCAEPDLESLRARVSLAPKRETLESFARAVPPMTGAENVTPDVLAALWLCAHACFVRDVAKFRGTVAEFLHAKNPVWNTVGRVFFHLAENKGDRERPLRFSRRTRRVFLRERSRSTARSGRRSKSPRTLRIENRSSRCSAPSIARVRRARSSSRWWRVAISIIRSRGRRAKRTHF